MANTKKYDFQFDVLSDIAKHFALLKKIPFLPILVDEQIKVITFLFRPSVMYRMSALSKTIKSWQGVNCHYHKFGGLQFDYKGREIGHLHGNGLLDLKLSKNLNQLRLNPLIEPHHFLGDSNWVSIKIRSNSPLEEIIAIVEKLYNEAKEIGT